MKTNYNLKNVRKKLGMNQSKIADALGMHLAHYNAIEKGRVFPSQKNQKKISEYFISKGYALLEEDIFPKKGNGIYDRGKKVSINGHEFPEEMSDIEKKIEDEHFKKVFIDHNYWSCNSRDMNLLMDFYFSEGNPESFKELGNKYNLSGERVKQILKRATIRARQSTFREPILNGTDYEIPWFVKNRGVRR